MARVGDIVTVAEEADRYIVSEVHWDGYTLMHPHEVEKRQVGADVTVIATGGDEVIAAGRPCIILGPSPDDPMALQLWDTEARQTLVRLFSHITLSTAATTAAAATATTIEGVSTMDMTEKLAQHFPTDILTAIGSGVVDGASAAVMGALALKIVEQVAPLQFAMEFVPEKYREHLAGTTLAGVVLAVDFFSGLPASVSWAKPLALTSIRGNAAGLAGKFTMPLVSALFKAKKAMEAEGFEIPHPVPDAAPRQKTM